MNRLIWIIQFKIIKLRDKWRIFKTTKLEHIWYYRKCSCGHPKWVHLCYEHGVCEHGVCLADPLLDEVCYCDGFNSMWNKQYPPHLPREPQTVEAER